MHVAILLYDGLTALDAIGPYEVLSCLPDVSIHFIAETVGPKRTDTQVLALVADVSLAEMPHPDIFLIPGGNAGTLAASQNERVLAWIREAHTTSLWSTSVCTGAYILGAAGILQGKRATTYWDAGPILQQQWGASYVTQRYVQDGKILTAAGVSAGIDMALFLACQLTDEETAQAIQLALEYDPQPPFDTGALQKASPSIVARAQHLLQNGKRH